MTAPRQLGLLWGSVAAILLVLSPWAARLAAAAPACPVKSAFGIPCLGCGTTRAVVALANLEIGHALALNPLAAIFLMVLVGGGLIAGLASLLGRGVPEPRWHLALPTRLGVVLLVLANWLYLVRAGT